MATARARGPGAGWEPGFSHQASRLHSQCQPQGQTFWLSPQSGVMQREEEEEAPSDSSGSMLPSLGSDQGALPVIFKTQTLWCLKPLGFKGDQDKNNQKALGTRHPFTERELGDAGAFYLRGKSPPSGAQAPGQTMGSRRRKPSKGSGLVRGQAFRLRLRTCPTARPPGPKWERVRSQWAIAQAPGEASGSTVPVPGHRARRPWRACLGL